MIFPIKNVILHSYVKLPEGSDSDCFPSQKKIRSQQPSASGGRSPRGQWLGSSPCPVALLGAGAMTSWVKWGIYTLGNWCNCLISMRLMLVRYMDKWKLIVRYENDLRCSMHGIFTYIWLFGCFERVNIGRYILHGAYGIYRLGRTGRTLHIVFVFSWWPWSKLSVVDTWEWLKCLWTPQDSALRKLGVSKFIWVCVKIHYYQC